MYLVQRLLCPQYEPIRHDSKLQLWLDQLIRLLPIGLVIRVIVVESLLLQLHL